MGTILNLSAYAIIIIIGGLDIKKFFILQIEF